jgi:hypothetical protein
MGAIIDEAAGGAAAFLGQGRSQALHQSRERRVGGLEEPSAEPLRSFKAEMELAFFDTHPSLIEVLRREFLSHETDALYARCFCKPFSFVYAFHVHTLIQNDPKDQIGAPAPSLS